MDQQVKVKEWFFDNLENVLDETRMSYDELIIIVEENDYVFFDEIERQCLDDLRQKVVGECSRSIKCSYDECDDVLSDKLETMFRSLQ